MITRMPFIQVFILFGTWFMLYSTNTGAQFQPRELSPSVRSGFSEVNPVLSVDEKTLYFSRINHPQNRYGAKDSQDIWYMTLQDDGTWSQAYRLPDAVNISRYNAILSALGDGKSFLILGQFNKKGTFRVSNGYSVIEKKEDGTWSLPRPVNIPGYTRKSRGKMSSAWMTPDGEVIIHSFSKRHKGNRLSLWVSFQEGKDLYTVPREIKTGTYNGQRARSLETPFLTPDKNRLYFSGNFEKDRRVYDIYYVDRLDDTYMNWSAPVRISNTINSPGRESYYIMNVLGNMAWYSSTAGSSDGASVFSLKLFEQFPYVKVYGRLVSKNTGLALPVSRNAGILINGQFSDSLVYDHRTGAFEAILPLGELYTFSATADNFLSSQVAVDVINEQSYLEKEVRLTLESVPWVDLEGQVLDNRLMSPLGEEFRPVLLINGEKADSVRIDPADGSYSLRLPFGRTYILGVAADKYRTIDFMVDLTPYSEHAVLNQNIFAERMDVNMVTLTGRMINTKTGRQLEEGYDVRMMVNGVQLPSFDYNPVNALYTIKLPAGFNYDLIPMLINFYNRPEPVDLTETKPMTTIERNFYVTPIEIGQSVAIEYIYFETGRAVLMPESFRSLNALVSFLKQYPNLVVEIGGHTDSTGSAALNQKLSEERAEAVASYALSEGITTGRIISRGYGPSKPVAGNETEEGRARNRRVDFTIIGL
jgi:outer membrane protein OmpA-like peptidoglycan-associated protein